MRRLAILAVLAYATAYAGVPGNMNVGGQGGHLNVPLASQLALSLPLSATGASECSGAAITGVTFSRSSSATCTKSDGTVVLLSANQPRVNANGLIIEGGATNFFLNSGTPATQTITLSTGTYTGWIDRPDTQTMTLAVGTAVATGLPCTAGASSCTFTISTSGTVTATITGTPLRAQVENSSFRTSYIPTAGTSAARTGDVANATKPAAMSQSEGCLRACITPEWSGNTPATMFFVDADSTAQTSRLLYSAAGASQVSTYNGTTAATTATTFTAGTKRCYLTQWSVGANSLKLTDLTSSATNSVAFSGFPTFDSALGLGGTRLGGLLMSGAISDIRIGKTSGACN
jgi:hypothetical protein